jgi:hypothetical protein
VNCLTTYIGKNLEMDWAWMHRKHGAFFIEQVRGFVNTAVNHAASKKTKQIRCPYHDCQNKKVCESPDVLKRHLVQRGFMKDYEIWTHHGKGGAGSSVTSKTDTVLKPSDDGVNLDPIGGFESFTDDWVTMDVGGVVKDHCNNDKYVDNCEIDPDMEELLHHMESEVLIGSAKGLENF